MPKTILLRNVLFAAALALTPLHAQQFEVASLKPAPVQDFEHCAGDGPSPGRLVIKCATLQSLIQSAYGLFGGGRSVAFAPPHIAGGPAWINTDHYTLEAKAEGTPRAEMMNGPMLQALLEDRFKLKLHREMREIPIYNLTVAKSGLKLQAVTEPCTPLDFAVMMAPPPPGQKSPAFCGSNKMQFQKGLIVVFDVHALSLADFAAQISPRLDRTVIDKTGAPGIFDYHLEFALDDTTPGFLVPRGVLPATADPAGGPSIFTAITQLGLKLEPAKGPVEFLVIDQAEKPSGN